MRKALIVAVAAVACVTANAALPSLTGIAESIASMQTRFSDFTNQISVLKSRLETATNLTARIEAVLNSRTDLRNAFHGGAPAYSFETNSETRIIQRIETYPDGYRRVEAGRARTFRTPAEAAQQLIERRNAYAKTRASTIEKVKASIATYEAASTNGTDAVAQAHAVIALYAARKQLQRLEAANTNVVTVTIKPAAEVAK